MLRRYTCCAIWLVAILWANMSAAREFAPGEPVALNRDEGLVAIAFNAPPYVSLLRIERPDSLFGGLSITRLQAGQNLRLIALPAGEYRWSRIDLFSGASYLRVRDEVHYHFRVQPGVINYPGDFDVAETGTWGRYRFGVIDRAGRLLAALDQHYPGVRAKFPMHYVGALPDPFPEFAAGELGDHSAFAALQSANLHQVTAKTEVPQDLRKLVEELFAPQTVRLARLNPAGDLIALSEFREGKYHVSVVNAQSQIAADAYRGDEAVRSIVWAGNHTLLMELVGAGENYIVHVATKGSGVPAFDAVRIPGRGWFVDPLARDDRYAAYAHVDSSGVAHLFKIDLRGERFSTAQFRSDLRLDKGLESAFFGFFDAQGTMRLALVSSDGDYVLMHRPDGQGRWQEWRRWSADEVFDPLVLSGDGRSLVARTNANREQVDLVRYDLATPERAEIVYSLPGLDIEGAVGDSAAHAVTAAMFYRDGRMHTEYLESPQEAMRAALRGVFAGKNVAVFDRSDDNKRALLLVSDEMNPGELYWLDRGTGTARLVLPLLGPLPDVHLASSRVLKVTASDGLTIEAYLTRPTAALPPYPLVVMPHGGPIGVHDTLDFDPEVQLLTNRGYAVLRVNYRGSGGFGRIFEEAGFRAWGRQIESDIEAATIAALDQPQIDSTRVAIRGASYGGYSALMELIRAPQRFRCGIAVSAVTDLPLLFTSSDWSVDQGLRDRMRKIVGDPAMALADLQAVSPVYQYQKIDRPVLLAHGALDRRVPLEHMLRLLLLMANGARRPPDFVLFSEEGHGLARLDARVTFEAAADKFLTTCLERSVPQMPSSQAITSH